MPRIKCHFCNNTLVVRPSIMSKKNYTPRCHYCRISPPPEDWRCQGVVASCDSQHTIHGRKKGDRCKCWVKEEGDKYCHYHKHQEEE